MTEYIKRETLMHRLKSPYLFNITERIFEIISEIPAADVAPVVHTYWAHLGGDEWCCPVCGFVITTEGSWDKPTKKYCEDCGAKMDSERKDGKDG